MNKDKNFSNLTKEQQDKVLSECCEGTNKEQAELVDSVFPSDTFIDSIMNEILLGLKTKTYYHGFSSEITTKWFKEELTNKFLKSSLQEQRQSILEEIEKKNISDPDCSWDSGYNQALEDIKQLLK